MKHHIQESEEASTFPAGDHKAAITDKHDKHINNKNDQEKKHRLGNVSKNNCTHNINNIAIAIASLCSNRKDISQATGVGWGMIVFLLCQIYPLDNKYRILILKSI